MDLTAEKAHGRPGRYELTPREREVLTLVAAGRSDGQIAEQLFISKSTAAVHVANIKGKLGATSRVEIATTAIEQGTGGADASPSAGRPHRRHHSAWSTGAIRALAARCAGRYAPTSAIARPPAPRTTRTSRREHIDRLRRDPGAAGRLTHEGEHDPLQEQAHGHADHAGEQTDRDHRRQDRTHDLARRHPERLEDRRLARPLARLEQDRVEHAGQRGHDRGRARAVEMTPSNRRNVSSVDESQTIPMLAAWAVASPSADR